ncbi:MAG: hypothetical protein ACR652_02635 [Methylocystis sp.]|uniref:hypothetical protein n=1 Tax=Methylocystis sp. TaxID=1911079 RepID=UPI003DA3AD4F
MHAIDNEAALAAWAADVSRLPESRLHAAERIMQPAAEREARRFRQTIDVEKVRASVTGLGNLQRAHPGFYASLFDPVPPPGEGPQPARRPAAHAEALSAAQEATR